MKNQLILSMATALCTGLLSACSGHADAYYTQYGVDINTTQDHVRTSNGDTSVVLTLTELHHEKPGKKSIATAGKDYGIVYEEEIKTDAVSVVCDKTLRLSMNNSATIPMGRNLFDYKDLLDINLLNAGNSYDRFGSGTIQIKWERNSGLQPGAYTFTVSGKTSKNNSFSDSAIVYVQ